MAVAIPIPRLGRMVDGEWIGESDPCKDREACFSLSGSGEGFTLRTQDEGSTDLH